MKSRKQRKLEAKLNGVTFTPQYNGTGVVSFEDYHGVGNERFDNKFVQFLKPSETPNELAEGTLVEELVEELVTNELQKLEESFKPKKDKSKKGKFKQKLKKLFSK